MEKHYSSNFTKNYIKDNVYCITGGSSGFGRETALEIIKMGGKAVIMGRHMEGLQGTLDLANELGLGDSIVAMEGDVSVYEDNEKFVKLAVEKFGKIDAFYANAGIMPSAGFEDHALAREHWSDCIDINLKGVMYGICAVYDQFKAQGYGHVLASSSIHGNFPTSGAAVYSATKIGVRYLLDTLRVENPGLIKTTYICPPGVSSTNLMSTIVKSTERTGGIFGANKAKMVQNAQDRASGKCPQYADNNDIEYTELSTEELVWSVMFALNQPRGVDVSSITMHPSNDAAIL